MANREVLCVDYGVGLKGDDIVGYGPHGERTDDLQEIVQYERDLRGAFVLGPHRLLVVHTTGRAEDCVIPS
ncbi:MAG TPA: hypothetical protein VFJ85_10480 [Acidimicrobiales bacterium]|nr:hypothetical protein [Acidimicrobiales bacterium]